MRVGVLTFHRCINYGSYWQARCLVEAIAARGHDAVLLDHDSRAVTSREWRYALQPLLPDRSSRRDVHLYARKLRRFVECFAALPLSRRFALEDPAAMPHVDVAVIGSDEVFNLSHPWYGGATLFWGERLNADRVVSYAASFGNHDEALPPGWAVRLAQLDAIAVRDANSRRIVADATGTAPTIVLDPVLLSPPPVAPPETDSYVLVYGHHLPDWFADRVQAAARERGWRTISVGYRNDWADDQLLDAGPIEFAGLVAGAQALVTSYFHGCVFALVNAKPFVCCPSPYRWNKVRDLTALLGAERHLTFADSAPDDVERLIATPIDAAVHARIAALRAHSNAYLDTVIGA